MVMVMVTERYLFAICWHEYRSCTRMGNMASLSVMMTMIVRINDLDMFLDFVSDLFS